MKKINILFCLTFLIFILNGCALNGTHDKDIDIPSAGKINIPKGTTIVKFVKKNGETETFLANGKRLRPCKFCPPGKQKECAKDKTVNYCKGNINSTINKVRTSVLIQSSVNPICWTEIIDGKPRQRCFCLPGETDPLCN